MSTTTLDRGNSNEVRHSVRRLWDIGGSKYLVGRWDALSRLWIHNL